MSFEYPAIPSEAGHELFLSEFNTFLNELTVYLNSREVLIPFERPQVPFEGQLMSAEAGKWIPAAGPGLYVYRSGFWVKLGRTSSFPVNAVSATFLGASPYTTVAGDITDPMTVWQIPGSSASDITLHTAGVADNDRIGYTNISLHVATIHYGAGATKVILLQPGDAVSFMYTAPYGWLLV